MTSQRATALLNNKLHVLHHEHVALKFINSMHKVKLQVHKFYKEKKTTTISIIKVLHLESLFFK